MPATADRRTFVLWLGGALLSGCSSAIPIASSDTGPDWVLIRQRGSLRVAADPLVGAPYFFRRAGQYAGFEWDILSALAQQLQLSVQLVEVPWPEQVEALVAQKVDLVLNGHEKPPPSEIAASNRPPFEATQPYYLSTQQLLFAPKAGPDWNDLEDLASRRVGVIIDSGGWALLAAYNARHRQAAIRPAGFRSLTDLIERLETGQIDAAIIDAPVAAWQVSQHRNWRRSGNWLPVALTGLVRVQDRSTREQIDRALTELIATAKLKAILQRWGLWNAVQEQQRV
ncbi:substrate-binding periplasmic protein [Gloeobacter kilaueensis]|uniref:Extracellular solute-binding protein n=1 Tax=Gloeobacter kilaueensis (strain ATCC BAA-2537 / CCAP 1431/1 / ULC 316 / JS1) TaxID=1183438 RepID=U5QGZ8_GLOK1|nr:transporter substrate-binding domain-containing protein [Gloeobacter kilaueensis]AGY56879.1 extracellular solute-binding protein [Gloeobacter kilaueensis JS1]